MMQPVRTTELPAAATVPDDGLLIITIDGVTYKALVSQFGTAVGSIQTISYDSATGTLSISGGNSVVITSADSPTLTTSSASVPFAIPAGVKLAGFQIKSTVNGVFTFSKISGAADQIESTPIVAGVYSGFNIDIFGGDAGQTVYFQNLTGTVTIKLFLQR